MPLISPPATMAVGVVSSAKAGAAKTPQHTIPARSFRTDSSMASLPGPRFSKPHTPCQTCPGWRMASLGAFAVLYQILDNGGIGERRGVAQMLEVVLGDLAQDAAHDLAGARLG